MDLILTGFIAGVLGTLMMDSLNHLFARYGVISKIDIRIIGRMAVGWAKGRFRYAGTIVQVLSPSISTECLLRNAF